MHPKRLFSFFAFSWSGRKKHVSGNTPQIIDYGKINPRYEHFSALKIARRRFPGLKFLKRPRRSAKVARGTSVRGIFFPSPVYQREIFHHSFERLFRHQESWQMRTYPSNVSSQTFVRYCAAKNSEEEEEKCREERKVARGVQGRCRHP